MARASSDSRPHRAEQRRSWVLPPSTDGSHMWPWHPNAPATATAAAGACFTEPVGVLAPMACPMGEVGHLMRCTWPIGDSELRLDVWGVSGRVGLRFILHYWRFVAALMSTGSPLPVNRVL